MADLANDLAGSGGAHCWLDAPQHNGAVSAALPPAGGVQNCTPKGRRHRRKNARPRSIAQLCLVDTRSDDELDTYHVNSRPADGTDALDLSRDRDANGCPRGADVVGRISVDNFGALDLSVGTDAADGDGDDGDDDGGECGSPLKPPGGSTDGAEAMKHYAENTVSELLGIYGLTDGTPTSVTRGLALSHFAPTSILDRHAPPPRGGHPHRGPHPTGGQTPRATGNGDDKDDRTPGSGRLRGTWWGVV